MATRIARKGETFTKKPVQKGSSNEIQMVKAEPRTSISTTAKSESEPARKTATKGIHEVSDHVKDGETSETSDECSFSAAIAACENEGQ